MAQSDEFNRDAVCIAQSSKDQIDLGIGFPSIVVYPTVTIDLFTTLMLGAAISNTVDQDLSLKVMTIAFFS